MPDDYYVLQRSGEEIDALLDKAGSATGAVRYDAAQSLTDAQKQQARGNIAAAPSGGGVMEPVLEVSASSASESYDTFCAKLDAVLATMPFASVKFLRVYPPQYYGAGSDICALFKDSNDYASVYTIGSYNKNRQGFRMIKYKRDSSDPAGQWDPLEYINPPMQLGVEYRTTERYLGKPVYVRLVSCGSAPSNSLKKIDTGLDYTVIDRRLTPTGNMYASSNDNFSIPCESTNVAGENLNIVHGTYRDSGDVKHDAIFIYTTSTTLTGYTVYVVLKYTKTTD